MSQAGYLLIADITGYTAFLSGSELEHARDSLNSLLELLVEHTQRPLLISRLEGDAVFSYAFKEAVQYGQTLVELVENTYLAFRQARQLMVVNTTCDCQACRNIPHLDLKFFIHHGTYSFQHVGEYNELVGTDVIAIHRLTKNNIVAATGIAAYAAYTAAAVAALGISELAQSMVAHTEHYEHIGDISVYVQDLAAVWRARQESMRFEVRPDDTLFQISTVLPLEPVELWQYVTRPDLRAVAHGSDWQKLTTRPDGRIGPDAVYECAHGRQISINTIVDWRPFEQYTAVETTPVAGTVVYTTYRLEAVAEGTRLTYFASRCHGGNRLTRTFCNLGAGLVLSRRFKASFAAFQALIEAEVAEQP